MLGLCRDPEGWGPLTPTDRTDFTPCFIDATVDFSTLIILVFGTVDIFRLLKRTAFPVKRDWHYWAKLVLIGALLPTTALYTALQIDNHTHWLEDSRFWGALLGLIGLGVAATVHYLEHARSRVARGSLLFYWLLFTIFNGVKVRSLYVRHEYKEHKSSVIVLTIIEAMAIIIFGLELTPKMNSEYSLAGEDPDKRCPMEDANIFSILTFGWMTGTMKAGYEKFLTEDDLWDLRHKDTAAGAREKFAAKWELETAREKPRLWVALFKAFGGPFFEGTIYKVIQDLLNYTQPQLLRFLIAFVASYQTSNPQPAIRGFSIAILMFTLSLIQTLTLHRYFQHAFETGMRFKTALTTTIYRKAMVLSNEGRASKSTGDIVNLQAVDAQRLQDVTTYGQQIWSSPFQITLCMASLYQLLGPSMFAGVAVMILMIPLNGVIAKYMKGLTRKQMKNKDTRTRLMTEILNNMKAIKLYAWTDAFRSKLRHVRNDLEVETLKKIGIAQSASNFTWSATPFMVSCLTFAVFVWTQDRPLTTEIVFPALALFNMLSFPLTVLPMVITAVVEAGVASTRITDFLTAEETQPDAVTHLEAATIVGQESVKITDGTFRWKKSDETRTALKNINFKANKGDLSCIVGRVGAGKSSLLQALLGDLWKVDGEVVIHGKVAYVSQNSWIMNATVKENIVFGHRFDPEFYRRTVLACALTEDFESLPDGDDTEVGEKGISLSGGQKARVSLARAVYARADIYILDDPLSAVDQHVGRHIIDAVLGKNGLLATKTRIMATNSIPVLSEANRISLLVDGEIVEEGTFKEVMTSKSRIHDIIRHMKETRSTDDEDSDETSTIVGGGSSSVEDTESSDEDDTLLKTPNGGNKARRQSAATLRRASDASFTKNRKIVVADEAQKRTSQTKEFSEQGKVKWDVYKAYARVANLPAVSVYAVALALAQTAQILGNVWLKHWSESNAKAGKNEDIGKYLGIYFAFGIGATTLIMMQNIILYVWCSIRAAKKMHDRMADAIFRSPMQFFETTPAGRILNRFSSDVYRVDEVLPRCLNQLFSNTAKTIGTLTIITVATPPFVALILPLGFIYLYIQRYYLRTSRELKRLDSVTKSPIYAHFQESLGGISTIRAYGQQRRFESDNEWRIDSNLKAYFPSINANRWLAVRLEIIGSVVILGAAGLAVIAVSNGQKLSPGMVGLAMSHALQITGSLNWIVRQTVEVETNIVAVERVLEYAALPSEAPEVIEDHRPPQEWPTDGAVHFNNFSARYRPELDLILKNISLDIKPQEKIGIVGRTGAGKSSLTLALFRIIEAAEGNINIDGLNTSEMGLNDLRQKLAIIPQDASLFEGSVRDNLDPRHVHSDAELWNVLELSHLKEHIASMDGKLEAKINEGGSNLSVGQRSLVSLARALLTPSKILVIDEATASVDVETDTTIQLTIRERFKDRTILTIAHRMNTIIDSDRCLVLKAGTVAEFDTPKALIANPDSIFHSLAKEAGLVENPATTEGAPTAE
ncbi:hypothetical protein BJ508DRAFT_357771 [Ascobolus immersus RN42]|uniref:Multidrug resistance-associated protein 1 n=1 Tax=Ascobolus immersus RN42 TaxID=1160509 RepID=A0A3N4IMK2_ASCIM|nr:hypothetical protein BJ508DRAFT_357771 [Ascobolus immersus RN42]